VSVYASSYMVRRKRLAFITSHAAWVDQRGALMIKLGIIGYGYWGPNVVRNFALQPDCRLVTICDKNPKAMGHVLDRHPSVQVTTNPEELLRSPEIDAVAIVTPVSTHYALARKALENGKHVFVEKPLTATSAEAEDLIELADRKNLQVMVDHTFLFTGAVRKLKELIDGGILGPLYYYDSTRVNLGLFQHDVNVIWDLAPHDLSIMDHLIGAEPELVVATGGAHLEDMEDVAYITLYFPGKIIAHINVNWLSPVKVRTTLIGGQRKMVVWNDLEPTEKIKVYDKGVEVGSEQGVYQLLVSYRSGDMWAPRIEDAEALKLEARYFLDCIMSGKRPFNDARAGLRVVRILEAATESLKRRTEIVYPASGRPDSNHHALRLAPAVAGAR
jgi:predicted dehydrogenase